MTMDLFAKLDPNVECEKLLAADVVDVLSVDLGQPVEPGGFKMAALVLARRFVAAAKARFDFDDEAVERMLVLEFGIILIPHLERLPVPSALLDLSARVASLARSRFFQRREDKKKDT